MDGWAQMTQTLAKIVKTSEERRREKNRRYYERNRDGFLLLRKLQRLRAVAKLLGINT